MKKCPFCNADIEKSAKFCIFCMTSLDKKQYIETVEIKNKWWKLVIVAVLIIVLILGVVLGMHSSENEGALRKGEQDATTTLHSKTDSNAETKEKTIAVTDKQGNTFYYQIEQADESVVDSTKKGNSKKQETKETIAVTNKQGKTFYYQIEQTDESVVDSTKKSTANKEKPKTTASATNSNQTSPTNNSQVDSTPTSEPTAKSTVTTKSVATYLYRVIAIMGGAFSGENIKNTVKKVIVPSSVKTIWNYAFSSCYYLSDIYFCGNSIYTEANAFADKSKRKTTLTIHCSSNCSDRNFRYYKNSASDYSAAYKEWNN